MKKTKIKKDLFNRIKEIGSENKIRGITLISLVITIVVLIILAVVAVNLSLGNNGLFNKAKTAKEQYQNAQDHEKTEVAKYSNEIDAYVSGNRDSNFDISKIMSNVSSTSTETYSMGSFSTGHAVTTRMFKGKTSKFGTVDSNGKLKINKPGLYYVSSYGISGNSKGQLYAYIKVNNSTLCHSFSDNTADFNPVSGVFYAKMDDELDVYTLTYNDTRSIVSWSVILYKIM